MKTFKQYLLTESDQWITDYEEAVKWINDQNEYNDYQLTNPLSGQSDLIGPTNGKFSVCNNQGSVLPRLIFSTQIKKLKVKFQKTGSLTFMGGELESWEGFPEVVDGNVIVSSCKLKSLDGCPSEVIGVFNVAGNPIESLEGISDNLKKVHGSVNFNNTKVKEGGLGILQIEGDFNLSVPLSATASTSPRWHRALKIIQTHLKRRDIFACQQELIEAGLEEFAKL